MEIYHYELKGLAFILLSLPRQNTTILTHRRSPPNNDLSTELVKGLVGLVREKFKFREFLKMY